MFALDVLLLALEVVKKKAKWKSVRPTYLELVFESFNVWHEFLEGVLLRLEDEVVRQLVV